MNEEPPEPGPHASALEESLTVRGVAPDERAAAELARTLADTLDRLGPGAAHAERAAAVSGVYLATLVELGLTPASRTVARTVAGAPRVVSIRLDA